MMRHEFSDKGERQIQKFGAFLDRLAKNIEKLALAIERRTELKEKDEPE